MVCIECRAVHGTQYTPQNTEYGTFDCVPFVFTTTFNFIFFNIVQFFDLAVGLKKKCLNEKRTGCREKENSNIKRAKN